MESYGANCIYVTDSAGYMLPRRRHGAHRAAPRRSYAPRRRSAFTGTTTSAWASCQLARGHRGRGCAMHRVAPRAGLGAGAGNTPARGVRRGAGPDGCRARGGPLQADGRRGGPRRPDDGQRRCASTATRSFSGTQGVLVVPAVRQAGGRALRRLVEGHPRGDGEAEDGGRTGGHDRGCRAGHGEAAEGDASRPRPAHVDWTRRRDRARPTANPASPSPMRTAVSRLSAPISVHPHPLLPLLGEAPLPEPPSCHRYCRRPLPLRRCAFARATLGSTATAPRPAFDAAIPARGAGSTS